MRQNERIKIRIITSYVAPRKRKPITWSYTCVNLDKCIDKARDFLNEHGGKFIKAFWVKCDCYDLPMGDGTDRTITMQEVPFSYLHTDIDLGLLTV